MVSAQYPARTYPILAQASCCLIGPCLSDFTVGWLPPNGYQSEFTVGWLPPNGYQHLARIPFT